MLKINSRCYVCGFSATIVCEDKKNYGVMIDGKYAVTDNISKKSIQYTLNVELAAKVMMSMETVGEPNAYGYVSLAMRPNCASKVFMISKDLCEEWVDDIFQIGDPVEVIRGTLTGIVQAYIFYENKVVVKSDKIERYKDKAARYTYKPTSLRIVDNTPLEANEVYEIDDREAQGYEAFCMYHKGNKELALVTDKGLLLCNIPIGTTLQKVKDLLGADRIEKVTEKYGQISVFIGGRL